MTPPTFPSPVFAEAISVVVSDAGAVVLARLEAWRKRTGARMPKPNPAYVPNPPAKDGSITLHAAGAPHGPQPGAVESSLGKTSTDEIAVMVDTFKPLLIAQSALALEDPKYFRSWIEEPAKV